MTVEGYVYAPNFEKVGGILLLACPFVRSLHSFVRLSRVLVHSITLEPCMLMF